MTRGRAGLARSYHGDPAVCSDDLLVHTKSGADAWCFVMEAGFTHITINQVDYPAATCLRHRYGRSVLAANNLFGRPCEAAKATRRNSLGESWLKHNGVAESPQRKFVRGQIKRERAEFPRPRKLTVSDTAEGDMERIYPAYSMLSFDAHASVTALERHFRQGEKGLRTVEVVPPFRPRERLETLDMACDVVLGACIGVSQILGGTSQTDAVRALFERFERQGVGTGNADDVSPEGRRDTQMPCFLTR